MTFSSEAYAKLHSDIYMLVLTAFRDGANPARVVNIIAEVLDDAKELSQTKKNNKYDKLSPEEQEAFFETIKAVLSEIGEAEKEAQRLDQSLKKRSEDK